MSAMIKVGDNLPDVQVIRGESEKVSIRELFAGKKGVLFAVPGAFTPTCTKEHLPGFVNNIEALKAAGAEEVACIATNDAFVMTAWGAAASAGGKVTILADPHAEFTKAVGMDSEKITEFLGAGLRSLRYSLVIKDSVVQFVNVEEAGGLTCSAAEPAIEQVKSL